MQMADGLASLNRYLATHRAISCGLVPTYKDIRRLKTQRDSVGLFDGIHGRDHPKGEFVPLEPLIKRSAAFEPSTLMRLSEFTMTCPGDPAGTQVFAAVVTLEWPKLLTSEAQVLQAAVRREFRTSHNLAKPRISQKCLACGYIRTGLLRSDFGKAAAHTPVQRRVRRRIDTIPNLTMLPATRG